MTSDLADLRRAFDSGKLVRPGEGSASLVDVARAVGHLNGAEVRPSAHSPALADLIGAPDHLVFVLADGVGMTTLELLPRDSFLRSHLAAEITAVFPSTTATALTTLATGEWPARHAVTGWWTHLPDIDGDATILEFTRRSDGRPLEELGVRPDRAFPAPPIAPPADRDVMAVVPNAIASTVFSTYSFGEGRTTGYDDVREAGQVAVSRALRGGGRTSTYLYFPHVDAASHYYGMSHETTLLTLRQLDAGLAEMARALRGRARIVVTADHGHLDAAPEAIHGIVDSDPLMRALTHPPSGDYRAVYLRPREGLLDEARRLFGEQLGERFYLVDVDEAEELELFGPGPLSPETRRRIGGLIAVSRGVDVASYRPVTQAEDAPPMVGYHSGLTPDEMLIPLIVA